MPVFLIVWQAAEGLLAFCLFYAVALVEAVNASCRVNELLLASVEGMAFGADFYADFRGNRGARLNHIATDADNLTILVFGVNTFLHN